MNIRKNVDYSEMYAALDQIMAVQMSQMELYCEIGKAVCQRREKGAAVVAAAYLSEHYPNVHGFSPRNLRRMRDFYRAYEEQPALLSLALQIGWTQNIVILEADLSMELRGWYIKAVKQFGWSKTELTEKIAINAHEMIVLAGYEEDCPFAEKKEESKCVSSYHGENRNWHLIQKVRCQMKSRRESRRRWLISPYPIFTLKQIIFMRC